MKRGLRTASHKLFRVSSFYFYSVLISSNTNTLGKFLPNDTDFFRVHEVFRELLPDNEDFFRVHIYQSYYEILYTFQSSYNPILTFSESYYPTIYVFHSSHKPVLINTSKFEWTLDNIKIEKIISTQFVP